ncbi:AFADIN [Salix purpurea]|uniref:AFADIN n=1 Tax=Salix purpurea TaxID=77065 RepID=A0A9Q0Q1J3_SALPP|nr:AFADIN [Salix purpurea]
MERHQLRRSSSSPISPLHSHNLSREGNGLVGKLSNFPNLASDSSSQSDDDLFTCELGWRSPKQAVGTPIKKLLEEEMSRKSESKRRSPSVIARLMGLDGLPPQQSSHKQQKKSLENYTQRTVLTEKAQRNNSSYGRRSSRKSSKDEQEFKDVFEVLDPSKMDSCSYSSRGTAYSKLTAAEMAFIQQKFMDAKRLSTDEKLQNSREFQDAIDDLDSNKDLLLKYLQQPDSLFTKHLHDLQGVPPQSHCGQTRISVMKPSHPPHCGSSGLGSNIERQTALRNRRKSHVDPASHSHGKHEAQNPVKLSNIHLDQKDESTILPTRIVVLKPNHGRMQHSTKNTSSPQSSRASPLDCRKQTEPPSIKNREVVSYGKKKFPDDAGPSRYKSRESREIAKEITRQMRENFGNGSMIFSTPAFRGYVGDESSSNMSENESANESEETTVTSRNSADWSNRYRPSSSCSAESSVSREAKMRLSERWKMTHKSVDMGIVSRSSTLGEMLAIPDLETRLGNSDAMICKKVFSDKVDCNHGAVRRDEPLGISSREGWKDAGTGNLSRSRSVPATSTVISSPRLGMRHENVCHDRYIIPKQLIQQERNRTIKGNFSKGECSPSRNYRSTTKNSHMSSCSYRDHSETFPEVNFGLDQVQSEIAEDDSLEQICTVSGTPASIVMGTNLVVENVVDVEIENKAMPSKPIDQESSTYMLVKGDSSPSYLEVLSSQKPSNRPSEKGSVPVQHPVAKVESPAGSKEADQPSPVSVLETPFPDDLSSGSECFESLSADLNGLRMQLQLLRLESEAYEEGPMLISSDEEDIEEGSVGFTEERQITAENREFSYIAHVCLDSGINDADPDTFLRTLHSPECPVNPLIFEELEKKYCNHASWPRSERRLLFDRLNIALQVIYQQYANSLPWISSATMSSPKWIKYGLKDRLRKLIGSQVTKANEVAAADKILEGESQWLDLREDVDVIGREIERLLTEELVRELVAV